jgi:hypothetical protein
LYRSVRKQLIADLDQAGNDADDRSGSCRQYSGHRLYTALLRCRRLTGLSNVTTQIMLDPVCPGEAPQKEQEAARPATSGHAPLGRAEPAA